MENKNEAHQISFLAHVQDEPDYKKSDPQDVAHAVLCNCQCMAAWDSVRRKPRDGKGGGKGNYGGSFRK
eukprot:11940005-Karenia_brevis.AAC.1